VVSCVSQISAENLMAALAFSHDTDAWTKAEADEPNWQWEKEADRAERRRYLRDLIAMQTEA
jgi:hypothetical protein